MSRRIAHRTCPLCEATCGLEITIEDDAVKVIRGDRDNPFSEGFICPKGTTLGRLHDDPDRIRSPLIMRDGRFVEATWEEALAEIDRRLTAILAEHGRQAAAVYLGNPNAHVFANLLALRSFARALGTPNIFTAATVDQMPKHVACGYMFGHPGAIPVPDIDRTDYLLMLGANPLESNGSLATAPDWPARLQRLKDRGGRLVVVDPRRTKTADLADEHLPIRPGSDAAWLLSLAQVLFDEGLVAADLVPVTGLEELAAAVTGFAPEATQRFTGIDPAVTRRIARDLAAAPTACVYGRIGTHTVTFGTLAAWAVDVLNVLTGNLD
ncbi:MAG TPA: molybdopterin-dependent oxidoreductase, partial [Acidimicrobiia bacterium]|nr:molybdopterin-dependent oxidoreductase [Acidimicrobiia bacterium]